MSPTRSVPGGAALAGSAIGGGFGIAWTLWGASGVSGPASGVIRTVGVLLGVAIIVASRRRRAQGGITPPGGSGGDSAAMFSSSGYRRAVALEVVALVAGALVLGAVGERDFTIAWFAAVVGAHFIAFGRMFTARYYALGLALIAAGAAGVLVGASGGSAAAVRATTGLAAAASLLVAAAVPLLP